MSTESYQATHLPHPQIATKALQSAADWSEKPFMLSLNSQPILYVLHYIYYSIYLLPMPADIWCSRTENRIPNSATWFKSKFHLDPNPCRHQVKDRPLAIEIKSLSHSSYFLQMPASIWCGRTEDRIPIFSDLVQKQIFMWIQILANIV
jgi:hypothetical protein